MNELFLMLISSLAIGIFPQALLVFKVFKEIKKDLKIVFLFYTIL